MGTYKPTPCPISLYRLKVLSFLISETFTFVLMWVKIANSGLLERGKEKVEVSAFLWFISRRISSNEKHFKI